MKELIAEVGSPKSIKFWLCKLTWISSAKNTSWCLLGCAVGDLGTIYLFQVYGWSWSPLAIMSLAMVNGLITSICLETTVLMLRSISFKNSLSTAFGMSFLSMLSMELAMNVTDLVLAKGTAQIQLSYLPFILFFGFITPWPYNYWRLKSLGKACH